MATKTIIKTPFVTESQARQLLKEYGSPLYIYNETVIRERIRELQHAFRGWKNTRFLYACKANSNPHILALLREEGAWLDCVSPWEVEFGLLAGFAPEQILFTVNNMSDEDMHFAVQKEVLITIDSLSRLERFGQAYPNRRVCIRLTPGVQSGHHDKVMTGHAGSKFGILFEEIPQVLAIAQRYHIHIAGLHEHTGSGIQLDKALQSMRNMMSVAKVFPELEFLDFGGGFPIPYRETDEPIDLEQFGREAIMLLREFCRTYGRELNLYFEPGRYLVAEAGILLCTVNTLKNRSAENRTIIAGVDTGFNHLIRPVLYGSYHHITNMSSQNEKAKEYEKYDIAGNICETGDVFCKDREIMAIREGDVLAIHDVGAYGMSMASNYNSRPFPAEILLTSSGSWQLIRRKQQFNDMTPSFPVVAPLQNMQTIENDVKTMQR